MRTTAWRSETRGVVLPFALFVLLLVASITVSLASLSRQNLFFARSSRTDVATRQAAHGGLAMLERLTEKNHGYGSSYSGVLGSGEDARMISWTFDATRPSFSYNNLAGTVAYYHSFLGVSVPAEYALLAVTAYPYQDEGRPLTAVGLYKLQMASGLAARYRVALQDVSGLNGLPASIYSNLRTGDAISPPAITLHSLLGEAYTTLGPEVNPVQIGQSTAITRVFYRQNIFQTPTVDIPAMLAEVRGSTNVVIVSADSKGKVLITDHREDTSQPLPFNTGTFTTSRQGGVWTFAWKGSGTTTLAGPVKYLFEGGLTLVGGPNIRLTNGAWLCMTGDLNDNGQLRSLDGTAVSGGSVTTNGSGAGNQLDVIAQGGILLNGGGTWTGLFYSHDVSGLSANGKGTLQGVILVPNGGVDAKNMDFVFDPSVAEGFQGYLSFNLVRTAWWSTH